MDNWNNEQNSDVSVSGQFSANPYQDQNQNAFDQNLYSQPASGAGNYSQPQSGQPTSGAGIYNQPQNSQPSGGAGNFNQAQNPAGTFNGQPNGNIGYGQSQNNYANGYGQPFANYNQAPYQGPGYTPTEMEEPVGVGEWTGLLAIATFVPCIGIILMLVWAFGGTEKKSKSNFCKAFLIIWLIKLALYALIFIIWGASLASVINEF